jgi:hypothetical protein
MTWTNLHRGPALHASAHHFPSNDWGVPLATAAVKWEHATRRVTFSFFDGIWAMACTRPRSWGHIVQWFDPHQGVVEE